MTGVSGNVCAVVLGILVVGAVGRVAQCLIANACPLTPNGTTNSMSIGLGIAACVFLLWDRRPEARGLAFPRITGSAAAGAAGATFALMCAVMALVMCGPKLVQEAPSADSSRKKEVPKHVIVVWLWVAAILLTLWRG